MRIFQGFLTKYFGRRASIKIQELIEGSIVYVYKRGKSVDIRINDILTMKKNHPCGAKEMLVLRSGMDFRLRCVGCGREFLVSRNKIEKNIKSVFRESDS